ncbi:MAG: ABC transporter ATP-binding protein [Deltaproteobacteria bacterium]|nr:ABC transporter ATP-binding protein [Deltaproteobacteria bacterium]
MAAVGTDAAKVPKLELDNLSVVYRGRAGTLIEAVRDMSLQIADKPGHGEVVVFLGPSGCGKSSILRTVAGLQPATRGEVRLDGVRVDGPSRDRGMVFQQYTSFPWRTVIQNVEYGLEIAGVPARQRRERAMDVIGKVGLTEFAHQLPKSLSGGMKQRVAIARTLVNKPRVLLLDEPFGALDPFVRWEMQSLVLEISRRDDSTILFITHDVEEAVYVADTIFVLSPRPATILHRVDVPFFQSRDPKLKASNEFRDVERRVLDMMYASQAPKAGKDG